MKIAINNIDDAAIDFGATVLPAFAKGAAAAGDFAHKIQGLPGPVKSVTTSLLGITAVTGGSLWLGAKVVNGIANTRVALQQLGVQAATTRTALAGIGKGMQIAAIIIGLSELDKYLQKVTNVNVENSTLGRSLTALGTQGKVTGTLAKTFGKDLESFGNYAQVATGKFGALNSKIFAHIPGETAYDVAHRNIKELDAALANMVDGGSVDSAKAAFDLLADSAKAQGVSLKDTQDPVSGVRDRPGQRGG